MRTIVSILFFTSLFSACKEVKRPVVFNYIDVSVSNSWTTKLSINIDSSKVVHVMIDSLNKGKTYYIGTINDSVFQIINKLAKDAVTKNHREIQGEPVPDGGVSGIEIITKNKKIQTLLFNSHEDNILDTLINQLTILNNYKLSLEKNSNFYFPSYDIITPKMEHVDFVAPIIKEDTINK